MSSGMIGVERRRSTPLGSEDKVLTTLQKFVDLCDSGCPDDEAEDTTNVDVEVENVLDSLAAAEQDDNQLIEKSGTMATNPKKLTTSRSAKAKLCDLFIDRTLVDLKNRAKADAESSQRGQLNGVHGEGGKPAGHGQSQSNPGSTERINLQPPPMKKSEEIWVRRVIGGRRSFRVTNFRGQQLPSILTEDVDEGNETNEASVTTWTSGTRNPLHLFDSRSRHRSGEGIDGSTKSRGTPLLDIFRPRSKSDASKLKKPTFLSNMKNQFMGGSGSSSPGDPSKDASATSASGHRPRAGSESLRSPVSKVMDMFRNRSHSVNASDDKRKKHSSSSGSWAPQGARRNSLYSHRPSDVSLDPAHAAILFRDSRGLPAADPFLERILNLSGEEENEILVKFFKFHKCYDLLPTSAKLVVFDTQLLVKKAFFALVYNGVRAAPLWDSSERKVIGMLTITDFIHVLHAMYHDSAGSTGKMSELEEHRVETWRQRFLLNTKPLISIDPDASLFDAICSLVNNRIHRLPVIDRHTGNVLHILTHKRILKFLFLYIHEIPRPSFLNKKLREVRIGTFDNVETAKEETPIIVALQKFLDRRVSALPIVDEQNRLLDIYARFDVINLAAEKTYNNLDITLKQANEHRNEWFEGVHKCTLDDTLFIIMEKIVKAEVHRLVVVDDEDRVTGVISLSDILEYIVMRPELKEVSVTDIEEAIRKEKMAFEAAAVGTPFDVGLDQMNIHENDDKVTVDNDRENPTIFEEDDDKT